MSSIKGYVEGLRDGIANNKERYDRYISVIMDKTEKLDKLIDELTIFSQLEMGHLDIHPIKRIVDEMLEEILNPIEMEFADMPIQLILQKPFPRVMVNADRGRLSQVFDNLIGNAKRYVGENGVITISAAIEDKEVKIAVKDNGTGIDSIDRPHVFELFYRSDKSRSSEYGGAGLGLAICKQIIEKHGGKIWVESTQNVGTEFYFTLPTF